MAKYKVTFKKSVSKDFKSIPNKDVKKILDAIERLTEDPRGEGCKKLSGSEHYRVRQGLYRIIYEIRDQVLIINVVKVAHRSKVYKSL
ncbi:type II toxin-antitoxin system RelE family toxin [Planctobacterium marinum]|uniref:type II toxin-antitoxin system RelE family toxin n=1 Tax=Planctobacterium marinum TaxID=1631968 RepID=UPI001E63602E|nr:type II toxin-antitoxin system RelE/ParE family toxin [Planctobacterium marinum]MCC2605537.1 type II toxin-antitoxin system RelE/ParE family toxin [Planctobacterium marinum]